MIILDASALTKLVIKEEDSVSAIKKVNDAIQNGEVLASPDIALAECLNAVRKHFSLLKDVSKVEANEGVGKLLFIWEKIITIDTKDLAQKGMEISIVHNLAAYDSLYAAASKLNNAPLFTFDREIIRKADELGIELL